MPTRIQLRTALALIVFCYAASVQAATITVDTLADNILADGFCSLREALANSDDDFLTSADCAAGNGDDTIEVDSPLFTGNPLTATIHVDPTLGRLTSTSTDGLTLAPADGRRLVLQGDGSAPLLVVAGAGRSVSLANLTLTQGGGTTFEAFRLAGVGDAQLANLTFDENEAGGLAIDAFQPGSATLSNCTFRNNRREGTSFDDNGAALLIFAKDNFDLTVQNCLFEGNLAAVRSGGAISLDASSWNGTAAGTAEILVRQSVFRNNRASRRGGALQVTAPSNSAQLLVTVEDSLFDGNQNLSSEGGGAAALDARDQQAVNARFDRVSFINNASAADGGALYLRDQNVDIVNSVFAHNQSAAEGGAIAYLPGFSNQPHTLRLVANTFVSNQAGSGGRHFDVDLFSNPPGWMWTFSGNAVAADAAATAAGCSIRNASQLAITGDGSVVADADCALAPGDTVADPVLAESISADPLKPRAYYPLPNSPAIDAWAAGDCLDPAGGALVLDHVSGVRPRDGDATGPVDCDAGAFEVGDAGAVTLSLAGTGSGTVVSAPAGIDCGATCQAAFPGGQTLTLTAVADAGSVFTGFSGDCTGTDACALVVDGNRDVTATFASGTSRQLTVTVAGDGSGSVVSSPSGILCPGQCSASFADSANVTLTATAEFDSEFVGFAGGGCSGTSPCVVTLSTDQDIDATFNATAFVLDVGLLGSGAGTVTSTPPGIDCPGDCAELFARTVTVTLRGNNAVGSQFRGWEGVGCSGADDCVLDMDNGPYAIDARFETLVEVTAVLQGNGAGTVVSTPPGINCPGQCSALFPIGVEVTLTPTPAVNSQFNGWTDIECGSFGSSPCVRTLSQGITAQAEFLSAGFRLTVQVDGAGQVVSTPAGIDCPGDCSETYSSAQSIELTATPDSGQVFTGWSGECTGSNACVLALGGNGNVTARFAPEEIYANGFED